MMFVTINQRSRTPKGIRMVHLILRKFRLLIIFAVILLRGILVVLMQVDETLAFRRLQSFEFILRVAGTLSGVLCASPNLDVVVGTATSQLLLLSELCDFRILDRFGNVFDISG